MRKRVLFSIISMFVLALSCIGCKASTETGNTPLTDKKQEHAEELPTIVPERGIIEDGTYINKTFGVGFKISETGYILTDEELYQFFGTQNPNFKDCEEELADGVLTASEMENALLGNIHDIVVIDGTMGTSVMFVNVDMVFGYRCSLDEYLQNIRSLAQKQDPECFIHPITGTTLGGEQYATFLVKDGAGTFTRYYARMIDNYVICMAFTSNGTLKEEKAFTDAFINLQE